MSRVVIAAVAALVCAVDASAQTAYFSAADDLPMPPGFSESPEASVFDATEGRVIVLQAHGAGGAEAVQRFYAEALPPLGWSFSPGGEALRFRRGRERLAINLAPDDAGIGVRIELVQQALR